MTSQATTPRDQVADEARTGRARQRVDVERLRESLTAVAFLAIFTAYGIWLGPLFLNANARLFDIHGNAATLILGLAVLSTLVAGHFDLSAASLCSLSTFLTVGLTTTNRWPFVVTLTFVLIAGLVAGIVNGLLVTKMRINAFIATLGTGGVFVGIAQVYSGGNAISPSPSTGQLPSWFVEFGQFGSKVPAWLIWAVAVVALAICVLTLWGRRPERVSPARWAGLLAAGALVILAIVGWAMTTWLDDISVTIFATFGIAAVLWGLYRYTVFGRYVKATGHNREAAALAGVKTDRIVIRAFALGGLLAAIGGVVLASNLGSAQPGVGTSFLLPAFAAAFLSTVILSPGQFTVWGTVAGGIFVVWISQGLVIGGVEFTWTAIIQGLALILTVALSTLFRRR